MGKPRQYHPTKPQIQGAVELSKPGLAARQCAVTLLTRVFDDGRGFDGLLDTRHGPSSFRNLGDADKSLVRAICTTVFRHRGEIDYCLNRLLDRKLPKNARHLIHSLYVAAAQILFLDVPDSAAVDLAVTTLRDDKRSTRFAGLANAILRRLSREKEELFSNSNEAERAVSNVAPWLRKSLRTDYGKSRLADIARQHMLEPLIDITVKQDPKKWAEELGGTVLFGNSVRLNRPGRLEDWEGYSTGEWWVQDAAASIPAHLLGDIKGKKVLDLCAAPGGKTAQLAAMGAKVTALEASQSRLNRLMQNMGRLQLSVDAQNADLFEWETTTKFDAVLLDAPCSSTGTIRRHPDVQWTKSPQLVSELAALQLKMILHSQSFLKPGGALVFSNCSINREEGEDLFAEITSKDQGLTQNSIIPADLFGLEEMITRQGTVRTLPSQLQNVTIPESCEIDSSRFTGLDGFFAARFVKSQAS